MKEIMNVIVPSVLLGMGIVILATAIWSAAGLETIVLSSMICFAGLVWLLMNTVSKKKK